MGRMSDYDDDSKGPCCRCACGFAFLLVFLGAAASAFAFATTWWIEQDAATALDQRHIGLWQVCGDNSPEKALISQLNTAAPASGGCGEIFDMKKPEELGGGISGPYVMYVRYVQMATMAVALFLLFLYIFPCCCSRRGKKCVMALQQVLISLAAAGQIASVVLFAFKIVEPQTLYKYSWSFYLAGIGAGFYVLAMLGMVVDACIFARS